MTEKKSNKRQIRRHAAFRRREKSHELGNEYRQPAHRKNHDNYYEHFDDIRFGSVFSWCTQLAAWGFMGPKKPTNSSVENCYYDQWKEIHGDEKDDGIDFCQSQIVK